MIDLVLPEARIVFAASLMQMHQDRKRVFVDRLGWDLPARGSWIEVDEFDNEYCVYLLARAPDGSHRASLRLLPSNRPHMLGSVFRELCAAPPPVGEDVWEISRLVSRPEGSMGTSMLRAHRLLALALVEFALCNGIGRYSLVTESLRLPALLSVGWDVAPLGLPTMLGGEQLQALEIRIDADTLPAMRERFGIAESVLRLNGEGSC